MNLVHYELVAIRAYDRDGEGYVARDEMYLKPNGDYVLRHSSNDVNGPEQFRTLNKTSAENWLHAARAQIVWRTGDRSAQVIPFPSASKRSFASRSIVH